MSALVFNLAGLLPARRALDRLSQLRTERLLDVLGSELESQTRRRLTEEKTAPDGSEWDEWSESYAARRPAKGGLLELEGNLVDSITYQVGHDAVTVGSNLIYAARQQDGDEGDGDEGDSGIPARPYLGVSADNLEDLGELVLGFLASEARG